MVSVVGDLSTRLHILGLLFRFILSVCEWPYHGGWEQGWHQPGVHMLPLKRHRHLVGHHYPGVKLCAAVHPWVIQCAVVAFSVFFFIVSLLGGGHCQWRWKPFSLFLPFFSVSFVTTVHPLSSAFPLLLSSCFFLSFSEPLLFNLTPSPPILPLSLLTGNFWRSFSILTWFQWMTRNPLPFTLSFSPSALG